MFNLGNGVWVSLEHIVSVSIQPEVRGDPSFGMAAVVADTRNEWSLSVDDTPVGFGAEATVIKGLRSLGYESPEAFCEHLLNAIREAKHG